MLENIFTSGFRFAQEDFETKLKYKFFNSILLFNMLITFMAAFVRLAEDKIELFVANFVYFLFAFSMLLLIRKYKNFFQIAIKTTLVFSAIITLYSFSMQTHSMVGVSWMIVILTFSFFLTDKRFTYFTLIGFIVSITAIYSFNPHFEEYTIVSLLFAFIPIGFGFIYLSFYEKRNEELHLVLKNKNDMLFELTNNLQNLVEKEVAKNKKQEELLARQSQAAALGEMMDAIAHQWIQPLSVISMEIQSLVLKQENEIPITKNDIRETHKNVDLQMNHLIHTINEFRSFFRINQECIYANVNTIIEATLVLLHDTIARHSLQIEVVGDKTIEISCIPNEFKHIFINLINNSKDAFVENNIPPEKRKIIFELQKNELETTLLIQDTAGGVPENIIKKIFKSNFTTKGETKGTGIGLYLSKQIVEKIKGTIEAKNKKDGVCFSITIPNQIH